MKNEINNLKECLFTEMNKLRNIPRDNFISVEVNENGKIYASFIDLDNKVSLLYMDIKDLNRTRVKLHIDERRTVVNKLYFNKNLTISDMAKNLNVSIGTITKDIKYIKEKLW